MNKLLMTKGLKIKHSQYVGDLEKGDGESQITLEWNRKRHKTVLIDLYISPNNKNEIGIYKGMKMKVKDEMREDFNRAIIKGNLEFVQEQFAKLINN